MDFIKSKSGWKIHSIRKPPSGIQEETKIATIPSEKKQIRLVDDSMRIFNTSVKEKSMSKMFNHISNLWQKQSSVAKFDEAFGTFYQLESGLMAIEKYSPQFLNKASIDENGLLFLRGQYLTKTNKIYFEHKYIFEGLNWRLIRFKINVE